MSSKRNGWGWHKMRKGAVFSLCGPSDKNRKHEREMEKNRIINSNCEKLCKLK